MEWGEDAAILRLQSGIALRARLVVAADGADSWLRGQAGIDVSEIDYRQSAVVANSQLRDRASFHGISVVS